MLLIGVTMLAAALGAHIARWLRVPGGMIVGAMVATGAIVLAFGAIAIPEPLRLGVFVAVGTMIGMLVTRDVLRALRPTLGPAVASAALLILAGVGIALAMRAVGIAPRGDVLATSPGALSVLSAAAAEHDVGAPTVALFHTTRIVLILLTLPLLVRLLPARPTAGVAPQPTPSAEDPPRRAAARVGSAPHRRTGAARQVGAALGAALAAGILMLAVGIDGALIFGTTLGAALVTLMFRAPVAAPRWLITSAQIGIGWLIGAMVNPGTLVEMRAALLPAVLAALLVIISGVGVAYLLRAIGKAPPGDVLATSPGAVEALAAAAYEQDAGAIQVAVFHTVRLLLVILSLPLLLLLLQS